VPAAPRQLGNRLAVLLGDTLVARAWQEALDRAGKGEDGYLMPRK
jgi:hypothetical protein